MSDPVLRCADEANAGLIYETLVQSAGSLGIGAILTPNRSSGTALVNKASRGRAEPPYSGGPNGDLDLLTRIEQKLIEFVPGNFRSNGGPACTPARHVRLYERKFDFLPLKR